MGTDAKMQTRQWQAPAAATSPCPRGARRRLRPPPALGRRVAGVRHHPHAAAAAAAVTAAVGEGPHARHRKRTLASLPVRRQRRAAPPLRSDAPRLGVTVS
jgi:hypothetical protein